MTKTAQYNQERKEIAHSKAHASLREACASLAKASHDFSLTRSLWNAIVDADDVDYAYHDIIGRVAGTLSIQNRFADDLVRQSDDDDDGGDA